jgi:hypothetical protein
MLTNSMSTVASIFIMAIMIIAGSSDNLFAHGKEKHAANATISDATYTKDIKPIFENKCSKCHGAKSPVHMEYVKNMKSFKKKMKGPRMNTYTHLTSFVIWPDTGSLIRALDDGSSTKDGKPGKMYKYLGKTDEQRHQNLKIFKAWVGNWTIKEWSEITKEEINKLRLVY